MVRQAPKRLSARQWGLKLSHLPQAIGVAGKCHTSQPRRHYRARGIPRSICGTAAIGSLKLLSLRLIKSRSGSSKILIRPPRSNVRRSGCRELIFETVFLSSARYVCTGRIWTANAYRHIRPTLSATLILVVDFITDLLPVPARSLQARQSKHSLRSLDLPWLYVKNR